MFTGIVQGTAPVVAIEQAEEFRRHTVELPPSLLEGLALGASVAHNGVCLTVTKIEGRQVSFDLIAETLRVTNLGSLQVGDRVNIERAARFGDEIGGHLLSGHVLCTADIREVVTSGLNRQLWIGLSPTARKYIFPKGYVGVDGVSLTIGEVRRDAFAVHLIPETLARTILAHRVAGERVNLEVDGQTQAVVETVERLMASRVLGEGPSSP